MPSYELNPANIEFLSIAANISITQIIGKNIDDIWFSRLLSSTTPAAPAMSKVGRNLCFMEASVCLNVTEKIQFSG